MYFCSFYSCYFLRVVQYNANALKKYGHGENVKQIFGACAINKRLSSPCTIIQSSACRIWHLLWHCIPGNDNWSHLLFLIYFLFFSMSMSSYIVVVTFHSIFTLCLYVCVCVIFFGQTIGKMVNWTVKNENDHTYTRCMLLTMFQWSSDTSLGHILLWFGASIS